MNPSRSTLVTAVFLLSSQLALGQLPFPGTVPGTSIVPALGFPFEGSGAVWHPRLQQLFTVSDNSRVVLFEASGAHRKTWIVAGDLEGITVADPTTNFVYVGIEHPDSIKEFDFV